MEKTKQSTSSANVKQTVILDLTDITSDTAFHVLFRATMGFPETYGCDMNGWITCMALLDDPSVHISTNIDIQLGEGLALRIIDSERFMHELPELFCAFIESVAFVNQRHLAGGQSPAIHLVFC